MARRDLADRTSEQATPATVGHTGEVDEGIQQYGATKTMACQEISHRGATEHRE
jgi:hypothetical protein